MTGPFSCFEVVRNLGELNHLVTIVSDLCARGGTARETRVQTLFEARAFNAYRVPFDDALDATKHFGLVKAHRDGLVLSDVGRAFQAKNPQRLYGPNQDQRTMLVSNLLFSRSPLCEAGDALVEDLVFNRDASRFEGRSMGPARTEDLYHIRFLAFSLGLLQPDSSGTFAVNPVYTGQIRRKIRILRNKDWMERDPTDLDLELSHHAEEIVADAERSRLSALGRGDLSASVEIVSEYDSTQGFDILSYQGQASLVGLHDRFIEVKSSTSRDLRFIITQRELERARELRAAYELIFVGGNSLGARLETCQVEVISDPSRSLFNPEAYVLSGRKLLVVKAS